MIISFIFGGYRLVAVFKEVRIVLCESVWGKVNQQIIRKKFPMPLNSLSRRNFSRPDPV